MKPASLDPHTSTLRSVEQKLDAQSIADGSRSSATPSAQRRSYPSGASPDAIGAFGVALRSACSVNAHHGAVSADASTCTLPGSPPGPPAPPAVGGVNPPQ